MSDDERHKGLRGIIDPELVVSSVEGRRMLARVKAGLFGTAPEVVQLDRYRLGEKLGQGGMASVYAAFDPQRGHEVAIKVVWTDSERGGARLRREARALSKIEHRHIVKIYDVGDVPEGTFIVMERLSGSLRSWLQGPRPWFEALVPFIQVGEALQFAHDAGLLHRDFKPDNVMFRDDGDAVLLDFGLAKNWTEDPDMGLTLSQRLTRVGAAVGTVGYASPEQLRAVSLLPASDQFSYCVALYEALFGRAPFVGPSIDAVAMAIFSANVQPVPEDSAVPQELRAVVLEGLSPRPEGRHPSMGDLILALREFVEQAR